MADRGRREGQQLGNYRLTRLLGQGGFAEVYLGEHVYLKSRAALKVLHTQLSEQDEASFLQEAQTLAGLSHPHIVRVLDFAVQDGTPFLVLDYAPHGTLRHRYAQGTRLPLETIVLYVQQVAAALQYAHDQRLIHRDAMHHGLKLQDVVGRKHALDHGAGLRKVAQDVALGLSPQLLALVHDRGQRGIGESIGAKDLQELFGRAEIVDDEVDDQAELRLVIGRTCLGQGLKVVPGHRTKELQQTHQNALLRAEGVVDGAYADASFCRDGVDGRAHEAALGEQAECSFQNAAPRVPGAGASPRCVVRSRKLRYIRRTHTAAKWYAAPVKLR